MLEESTFLQSSQHNLLHHLMLRIEALRSILRCIRCYHFIEDSHRWHNVIRF